MKMKKYILMMAAAVLGFTACQEEMEELQLLDPSQVVAPVLHQLPSEVVITADNMSETITFEWDKAYFGQPVQYTYTIYASTDGGATLVKLYPSIPDLFYETTYEAFNQLVTTDASKGGLGLVAGENNEVTIVVGATVGTNYQTFYSNAVTMVINPTEAERVYKTVWLPGSANGWDHSKAQHLFCYAEDDNTFVGTTDFGEDFASNQFKLTGAADWSSATGNWGVADPSAAAESGTIQLLNDSNDNITQYTAHRYYNFTFTKSDLTLKMNAGFDQVGIIGLNGDWNTDIVMTLSKKQKFYADIDVPGDTEFKFRLDAAWGTNWGGDMSALSKDGANIAVSAGQYRVYFDLNDWNAPTCKLDASMYGKEEDLDDPEPPVVYVGWGIIGDFNDWGGDAPMTEKDGVWTGYFTNTEDGTFKLRKDADWAENYGGSIVKLGEPFEAVAGGDNLSAPAGFYKVVLDLSGSTPMITVSDGSVWSLIGVGGDWNNDIDMELTDGKWVSPATTISGEFKLRYNHGWDDNRGGSFASVGATFDAVKDGSNINVPEGEYIVTYDPAAETILVEGALPSDTWSLIGVAGDWNNDIFMTKLGSGLWVSPVVEFGGEFKLRFNHDWAVNRGGAFEKVGTRFAVTNNGANINVPDGKYQIIYNPAIETVTVNTAASGWSIIGEVEGHNWDFDLYMSEVGSQVYESDVFRANGGFKIRYNGGWDVNRGGAFEADGADFTAVDGGSNIDLGSYKGQLVKITYNAASETLNVKVAWCIIGEVNGTSWGEDFAMTETSAGVWEGSVVVNGGFKIRKSGNWDINRGGNMAALGTAFTAVPGGDNISVPENNSNYKVVYKESDETITVSAN